MAFVLFILEALRLNVAINDTIQVLNLSFNLGVSCDALQSVMNGRIISNGGTSYPSTVTYECNEGYSLVGSATISCGISGTWSNEPPFCNG